MQFQSTLPRRERPSLAGKALSSERISIHAPAKGATAVKCLADIWNRHFNPRSREGSDGGKVFGGHMGTDISIHAPAKGATTCGWLANKRVHSISIHAPAKGATKLTHEKDVAQLFQSTLPRRERQSQQFPDDSEFLISIHAPAKGATAVTMPMQVWISFQSTLPRRERPIVARFTLELVKFQSTLPRRERQHLLTSFRLQYGYSLFHLTNKI